MPAPAASVRVLVLAPPEGREKFESWRFFDREQGNRFALRRLTAAKSKPQSRPDVFDSGEAMLRAGSGHSWFLEDYRPLVRRTELARDYAALTTASELSGRVVRHVAHVEDLAGLFSLLERAWDALCSGYLPAAVELKFLYAWARSEGYPVREVWWTQLSTEEQTTSAVVLNRPLADLEPATSAVVLGLRNGLVAYLARETELG